MLAWAAPTSPEEQSHPIMCPLEDFVEAKDGPLDHPLRVKKEEKCHKSLLVLEDPGGFGDDPVPPLHLPAVS